MTGTTGTLRVGVHPYTSQVREGCTSTATRQPQSIDPCLVSARHSSGNRTAGALQATGRPVHCRCRPRLSGACACTCLSRSPCDHCIYVPSALRSWLAASAIVYARTAEGEGGERSQCTQLVGPLAVWHTACKTTDTSQRLNRSSSHGLVARCACRRVRSRTWSLRLYGYLHGA